MTAGAGEPEVLLLRLADVARLVALSPRRVQQLVSVGDLPRPVAVGRSRRWRRADLEAWVAALPATGTPPLRLAAGGRP
jgi:excisionase family DNA binding protein